MTIKYTALSRQTSKNPRRRKNPNSNSGWKTICASSRARPKEKAKNNHASDKCAEAGDGTPYNQGIYFLCSFIRINGLGICQKTGDIVFQQDAVASHNLTGLAYNITGTKGAEYLGQRSMFIPQHAAVLQFRKAVYQCLHSRQVRQHFYQMVLN